MEVQELTAPERQLSRAAAMLREQGVSRSRAGLSNGAAVLSASDRRASREEAEDLGQRPDERLDLSTHRGASVLRQVPLTAVMADRPWRRKPLGGAGRFVGTDHLLAIRRCHRPRSDPRHTHVTTPTLAVSFAPVAPQLCPPSHRVVDPEDQCCAEAEATLAAALPALGEAAGAPIAGIIGGHDPFAAAWDALNAGAYDEVIVSIRPSRSRSLAPGRSQAQDRAPRRSRRHCSSGAREGPAAERPLGGVREPRLRRCINSRGGRSRIPRSTSFPPTTGRKDEPEPAAEILVKRFGNMEG